MKKKSLALSVLSLAMCGSLAVGATYALFTSEANVSIAVTSGKINVTATTSELDVFSPLSIEQDGSFAKTDENNGSKNGSFVSGGGATKEGNEITLSKMMPGDSVDFTISVKNEGSVTAQYRTVVWVEEDGGLFDGLDITVNGQAFTYTTYTNWAQIAPGSVIDDIPVSIELPGDAPNEYQEKSAKIMFKVEAIQSNAVVYNSVEVNSQKDLNEAIEDADAPIELYLPAGTYTLPTISSAQASTPKNVSIQGTKDTIIDMTSSVTASGSTVIFDGVTIEYDNGNYDGLQHSAKEVYKNCTIKGTMFLYAPEVEFIDCTFEKYDAETEYNVWTYGATNVTFSGCTFNTSGKAILVYNEYTTSSFVANVTVDNCTFNSDGTFTDKAAVETGSNGGNTETSNKYNLVIKNSTVNGFAYNPKGIATGTTAYGNKNSMDADHLTVVVENVEETDKKTVAVSSQTDLNNVIEDATTPIELNLPAGTYTLPTISSAQASTPKNVSIQGTKDTIIDMTSSVTASGSTVIFDGVTIMYDNGTYDGLQHSAKEVYKNCTIKGTMFLYAPEVEFIDCTFEKYDAETEYNVWTYGATNVTFTGCTFNTSGKAILVYNEYTTSSFVANVTVDNCTFNSDGTFSGKAAVETGSNGGNTETSNKYNLVIKNSTVNGFSINPNGINTGTTVYGNKNSMDGDHLTVVVENVEETDKKTV